MTHAGQDAFLGLGSNVGARADHLAFALRRLGELGRIEGVSDVYETSPVGYLPQPDFLNLVVRLRTALRPIELLEAVRAIEEERGRERRFRNAPRTLDIDILLYGDRVVTEPGLEVPHPRMTERAFVLVPLLELDADIADPRTGVRYAELEAADPSSSQGIERVMPGERLLHGHDT
ncbi:MAG: 2-amino-4-hydroxy-6-hydroxymethyldihydropteridine diphosphokinase [Candidatus Longimicrobiales bacterium M2_2A_002]